MFVDPASSEAIELLLPLLTRPGTVITGLFYFAVLVPLVEEIFKPLGVWMLAGKLNTSSQGFVFGALSGAGYALLETINVSGQVGEWGSLLFTRIGTGLLHVTTSAIMGAAIVMAWRERRYLRLLGTYLLAVLLHGLWNAAAVTYGFSTATDALEGTSRFDALQTIAIATMILLVITFMVILLTTNHKLRDGVVAKEAMEMMPADNTNNDPSA
jgi:RsiW-degrading membrane proteinase PrsW (M82 family)